MLPKRQKNACSRFTITKNGNDSSGHCEQNKRPVLSPAGLRRAVSLPVKLDDCTTKTGKPLFWFRPKDSPTADKRKKNGGYSPDRSSIFARLRLDQQAVRHPEKRNNNERQAATSDGPDEKLFVVFGLPHGASSATSATAEQDDWSISTMDSDEDDLRGLSFVSQMEKSTIRFAEKWAPISRQ